jgi:hypothetical protein
VRGWLDKLAGGKGMTTTRTDANAFQPGDILEGWSVEQVEAGRLIRLRFAMKAPGPAWLQLEAQAMQESGSMLILTSFFEPHGVVGMIYWYCLYPFHQLINKGMSKAIVKLAEEIN